MIVMVPPRMAAKESGMRSRDGGSSRCRPSARNTGRKVTTTAVLLRKGEIAATIVASARTRAAGGPSGAETAHRPMIRMAPVFSSPRLSTSIAPTVSVAGLETPALACVTSMIPPRSRTTGIASATWSIGIRSVTKRTSATPMTPNT